MHEEYMKTMDDKYEETKKKLMKENMKLQMQVDELNE